MESRRSAVDWQPVEVNSAVFVMFNILTQSDVCTTDPDFITFAVQNAGSVSGFINEITSTNFASFDGENLSLTTENLITVTLPDGRFYGCRE